MIELFRNIIDSLNDYAGLFSLLAVLTSVFVPYVIYKKGRNDERQALQDELEAREENSFFPMSIEEREYYAKNQVLRKKLNRK